VTEIAMRRLKQRVHLDYNAAQMTHRWLLSFLLCGAPAAAQMPVNSWVQLARDAQGARRNSSFRYVNEGRYFLLWGFMGHVTDQYGDPETPWHGNNEYDLVVFDPRNGKWESQYPFDKESAWRGAPPPMHQAVSYQGITTGSYRPQLKQREGALRPDLNIVFDQLAYDTKRSRMIYFTGGRTFAYDVRARKWSDAASEGNSPPPVSAATLSYDPFNDEIVLAGGGHVAEPGPGGRTVGYTGTWLYQAGNGRWRALRNGPEPPPRMSTRLVTDTRNKVMVMFGGDGQSRYLADTWIYDTRTRQWRPSKAAGGPPPRAGHFTVYDPGSGWVIVGGGYNRQDLTDMWAYDAAADRWMKLKGTVPVGWHVTADSVPDESLIVLTTSAKREGDTMGCNEIYPVRTTYGFRIRKQDLVDEATRTLPQQPMFKRDPAQAMVGTKPDPARRRAQSDRISRMPANQWVHFTDPGRAAPLRTWGSASFDTDMGRIIYWGGGHCGYGGSDYDFYDVEENTWISSPSVAEHPEKAWDLGINPAGVTFSGAPFVRHGRKAYAYDPVSKLIINLKRLLLTGGYEPEAFRDVDERSSGESSNYKKWVTTTYRPEDERWDIIVAGARGLDLAVTTPKGVMAVDYHWDSVDSTENSVYLLDVAGRRWNKLTKPGPHPRNLYEMTALVYDSKRDQLILHGAGPQRDELWRFPLSANTWEKIEPRFATEDGTPPVCNREAVYIPEEDSLVTVGRAAGSNGPSAVYVYHVAENRWSKTDIAPPAGKRAADMSGQNRAWTYDPKHHLILMVLGDRGGDSAVAQVFALRYQSGKR
jgi:hypothetical protein